MSPVLIIVGKRGQARDSQYYCMQVNGIGKRIQQSYRSPKFFFAMFIFRVPASLAHTLPYTPRRMLFGER
jgi:hypothetical protein